MIGWLCVLHPPPPPPPLRDRPQACVSQHAVLQLACAVVQAMEGDTGKHWDRLASTEKVREGGGRREREGGRGRGGRKGGGEGGRGREGGGEERREGREGGRGEREGLPQDITGYLFLLVENSNPWIIILLQLSMKKLG